jgi:flagellar basal-body rod protein FlgB
MSKGMNIVAHSVGARTRAQGLEKTANPASFPGIARRLASHNRRNTKSNPPSSEAAMIDKLSEHLRFNSEALRLRSTRQQLLASNVVNAETPRYQAQDFDFARALRDATARPAANANTPALYERASYQPSLDGNTVDMDAERAHFADNALRYEAALRALNMQLKTLLSAIQG